MFVFLEGNDFPMIPFNQAYDVLHIPIRRPLSFKDAIIELASKMKDRTSIFVFWNFFKVGCSELASYEKRGLERIAMGVNAIEYYFDRKETRFMPEMNVSELKPEAMASTAQAISLDTTSFGIGNFRKHNTLLVGDTPGKNSLGYNTPFVGSGSGLWLLKLLEAAEIPEDKYYWINSADNFGIEAEYRFLEDLCPKKIITLGNEAASWARRLETRYTVISCSHPQYWLSFKSGQEYPLIKLLKQ